MRIILISHGPFLCKILLGKIRYYTKRNINFDSILLPSFILVLKSSNEMN